MRRAMEAYVPEADEGHLQELWDFGSNPGQLRALIHLPPTLKAKAPLVVVLHGCTQTAAGYDRGSGWSALADRHGFAVLFPEQRRANNSNLCFNWFSRADARRGRGETLSIKQIVSQTIATHAIDPARVFVTGLSAGGAMTSVMLATYPELFAGGAIVAGLPFGDANTLPEALERMRGQGRASDANLAALVAGASKHKGPWPTLSVWHGTNDATVVSSNADAVVGQWRSVHQVGTAPDKVETINGHRREVWRGADGREVIEKYSIKGMGHGTPVDTRGGSPGSYALDANISSTHHIALFWGLIEGVERSIVRPIAAAEPPRPRSTSGSTERRPAVGMKRRVEPEPKIATVIEDALRAAGLMR